MLASLQEAVSLPAVAGLADWLWVLKGTHSHHLWPCSFTPPWAPSPGGVLHHCFHLLLRKRPLLIHLFVHMHNWPQAQL